MTELTLTRVYAAPRELVFSAWTDPDQFAGWLGPHGFTAPSVTLNLTVGGNWRACMRNETTGAEVWVHGVYREIVPPERLVFTWEGEALPEPTVVTLTFAEDGGKTELTLHHAGFPDVAARDDHTGGWTEALEELAGYLEAR